MNIDFMEMYRKLRGYHKEYNITCIAAKEITGEKISSPDLELGSRLPEHYLESNIQLALSECNMRNDHFNLTINEHTSAKYPPRTFHNAKVSDYTLAFAVDFTTAGEKLTAKAAEGKILQLPLQERDAIINARRAFSVMKGKSYSTINIAGNGIYTLTPFFSQLELNQYLYNILAPLVQHLGIKKIVSGGQTGVDQAGAIAGMALGLEVEVTLPKGLLRRYDTRDVETTKDELRSLFCEQAHYLSARANRRLE